MDFELDKLVFRHTVASKEYGFLENILLNKILENDVIALGEIHGICEASILPNLVLKLFHSQKINILILLEREFIDSDLIQNFIDGVIPELPSSFFPNYPKVSLELANHKKYLDALRDLNQNSACNVKIACIDIIHRINKAADDGDKRISMSKDILNILDDDIFDFAREQFMFKETLKAIAIHDFDKILFCGGNAHISRSSWYFTRKYKPELHVPTLVSRLEKDLKKSVFSVYFFPYSGFYRYQKKGELIQNQLDQDIKDPLLLTISQIIKNDNNNFFYTDLEMLPRELKPYKESWNSIFSVAKATLDKNVINCNDKVK